MKISEFLPFSYIIIFLSFLLFSFFLNYISALYSEINLFKIDLVKKRQDKKRTKKLIFILKNGNLLFALICFYQVFLNIYMSDLFMKTTGEPILKEIDKSHYRWTMVLGISLLIALCTEILVRYLANRPSNRKRIFNNFFIDFAYSIVRPFYFLRVIVKPRKKIFVNSEEDIIRFINNLTTDNILELNEAKLVQSAFNFDEQPVSKIVTPWKRVITLSQSMSYSEVQNIHSRHFFTRYPVLNQKKEIVGTFNMEVFYWRLITKKDHYWLDYVDKKVIYLSPDEKLDKVLIKLQTNNCRLAIIREKKRIFGIVTLQDVLGTLVGKIRDERDMLLLPSRSN